MLSGDVELNPGPLEIERLGELIENLASTAEKHQNETRNRLDSISSGINELKQKVCTLEKQMQEISAIKDRLAVAENTISGVQRDVRYSQDQICTIESSIDDLNNRMRRNNLLVRGIPEKPNETWEETANCLRGFIQEHLGIEPGEIERAHRVGRRQGVTARPIVVRFLDFRCKQNVLNNANKLKHSPSLKVSISEDFSPRVCHHRSKLWEFSAQFRNQNIKVKLVYDKLYVEGKQYVYCPESDEIILVKKLQAANQAMT